MSPAEIRETLWNDYLRLARYWADHPPLRDMVAAFMGVKPKTKKPKAAPGFNPRDLAAHYPGGRLAEGGVPPPR